MVDDTFVINPTMRIFHAEGAYFAGWQPMDQASLPLHETDFVLLDVIGRLDHRSDIVRTFRTEVQRSLLQGVSRFHSIQRLNELKQAQVLLDRCDYERIEPEATPTVNLSGFVNHSSVRGSFREKHLRLSKNFMFRPAKEGFEIWSSVSRCHHVLSLDMALILVFFSSGKRVNQYITETSTIGHALTRLRAAKWLNDNGILVDVLDDSRRPRGHNGSASQKVTRSERVVSLYKPSDLDGRIPIYFVPHMPNHFPLALGMMYSFITEYGDGALLDRFMPVPIVYSTTARDILTEAYGEYGQGVWLFSNYMWSMGSNLEISAAVKRHNPKNITIHGGPSTPSYEAACASFLARQTSVDIAVHGEGELTIVDLLEALASANMRFDRLDLVNGITYRDISVDADGRASDHFVRTSPRARIQDLNVLPSPYLSGAFDSYMGSVDAAIIESNRGCPFGCTFCDWGSATNQKIRKFDLQRVKDEIEWIGKSKVRVLWVADANFGIYDRDIELARWICDIKKKHGFPKEVVVNYTKNATKRLAVIVELFAANNICSQGVISIQTRDTSTLEVINRKNIKTNKYDDLAEIFRISGLPLSTDLMLGLPGMTVESFKKDLQYFFDKDVTVKAYPTELLPNSPMADPAYIEKFKIEVDQNNFLASSFSYTRDDLHVMNMIYYLFTVADSFSALRYVLRYLSWDHDIVALDYLHKLYNEIVDRPYRYPTLTYVSKVFQYYLNVPGGWQQFYDEIAEFTESQFGVERDSAFDAILYFNETVMPDDALSYPLNVQLNHDIPAYFRDNNLRQSQDRRPLRSYPPAQVTIHDKYLYGHINYNREQYDSHQIFWELQSPTARIQSVPNFM